MLNVIYAECHLCLVSQISPLCWVSLRWMSLCWMSWRLYNIIPKCILTPFMAEFNFWSKVSKFDGILYFWMYVREACHHRQGIGLHHPLDGITSPLYKLLRFIQLTNFFCKEKKALAFNRDRCCHLALCLQLMLFHWTGRCLGEPYLYAANGITRFEKCKQLLEYKQLFLLRHLMVNAGNTKGGSINVLMTSWLVWIRLFCK